MSSNKGCCMEKRSLLINFAHLVKSYLVVSKEGLEASSYTHFFVLLGLRVVYLQASSRSYLRCLLAGWVWKLTKPLHTLPFNEYAMRAYIVRSLQQSSADESAHS